MTDRVLGTEAKKGTRSLYGVSGIYQIKNVVNGKLYIGGSVSLGDRLSRHKIELREGKHKNSILQNAYNKYGASNFVYSIRLICPRKDVLKYEQAHLDKIKPEYNIALDAQAPQAGRTLSKEHREKLMMGRDKYLETNGVWNKGKKLSETHCRNLSLSHIGHTLPEEQKKKLREYNTTHPNSGQFKLGNSGNNKLTEVQVIEIRANYENAKLAYGTAQDYYKSVGDKYGVEWHCIRSVIKRKTWRDIC